MYSIYNFFGNGMKIVIYCKTRIKLSSDNYRCHPCPFFKPVWCIIANGTFVSSLGIGPTQSRPTVQTFDLNVVAEKLSGQIVTVAPPEVLGSTAVKLAWEVRRSQKYVEGFHIRYRAIPELDEHQGRSAGGSHTDFVVETVSSLTTTMYTLHNLEKNTWYEINVQPFYLTIVGQESNTVRVRTLEDGRQTLIFKII